MPDMEPQSYRDIQDSFNQLQAAGHPAVQGMSLHDYSAALNKQTNSTAFNAGLNPNFVKDASAGVDRVLDATGVTSVGDQVGRALGGLISPHAADVGGEFGRGIVRPVVSGAAGALVGAGVGTLVEPGAGTLAGGAAGLEESGAASAITQAAWRLFGSNVGYGANQGVQTYTDTDSVKAGAAAGTLGYLAHGFGSVGESAAARLVGSKIGSILTEDGIHTSSPGVLPTLAEMATEKFGLTAGYTVNNELTRQAVNLALGQGLSMPSTKDAVSDVAQAAAPLILGVAHDVMGLHAAQQPGRDVRSLSESMNLVDAAQKIRAQQIKSDTEQAALAAHTTLEETKKADTLRAGALPTEEEISGQVLSPEDKEVYADAFLRTPASGPLGISEPTDRSSTALGQPIANYGVDSTQLSLPNNGLPQEKPAQSTSEQPPQQTQTPAATATGAGEKPVQQATETTPKENVAGSGKVEPSGTVERAVEVPAVAKPVVDRIPAPPTLDSLLKRQRGLSGKALTAQLEQFQQLVHLNVELHKQVQDSPELRNEFNFEQLSDEKLASKIAYLMTKDGGFLSATDAVQRVYDSERLTLVKQHPSDATKGGLYQQVTSRLSEVNERKFQAAERAQDIAVRAAKPSSKEYFLHALDGPLGDEIRVALEDAHDVPVNEAVAIERWTRQTLLNRDPEARRILKAITARQKELGRKLKPDELSQEISGLDQEQADNIRDLASRNGALWTRFGDISGSSKLHLLLKDHPTKEGYGGWDMTLGSYIEASARREKSTESSTVSMDKAASEGGESTLAHTDLSNESASLARERHADPTAVEVATKQADSRIAETKKVREIVYSLDTSRKGVMSQVFKAIQVPLPNNLDSFHRMLCTYADMVSLTPAERVLPHLPKNSGGEDAWLMHGEDGSHSSWRAAGESNFPKWKKLCRQFYGEYIQLDKDGKPQINPKYSGGQPAQAPIDTSSPFASVSIGDNWTEAQKDSVTTLTKPAPEQALALSARAWFSDYLTTSGLDETSPMFKRYQDSMTRIALLFPQIDKTRVGDIVRASTGHDVRGVAFDKLGFQQGSFSKILRFVGLAKETRDFETTNIYIRNLTAMHEFTHSIFSAFRAGELTPNLSAKMSDALETVRAMGTDERASILNSIRAFSLPEEIYKGKGTAPESQEIMHELAADIAYGVSGGKINPTDADSPEEFLAVMFSHLGVGLANPAESTKNLKNFQQLRMFIPDRLEQFRQAFYTDLLHYTKALTGFFNEHSPGLGDKYFQLADTFKTMAAPLAEREAALASVHLLESRQPEQYIQLANDSRAPDITVKGLGTPVFKAVFAGDQKSIYGDTGAAFASVATKMVSDAYKALTPDPRLAPIYGEKPGFWSLFTPLAQFAERFPVLRPLADTLLSFEGNVNSGNALALSPFATRTVNGKIVKTDNLDALKRLTSNPATHNLLNNLYLWQNENSKLADAGTIAKFGPSLSAQQQSDVLHVLTATSQSMQTVGQGTLNTSLQSSGHLVGSLAMSIDKGMSAKTAEQVGTTLMKALIGVQSQDPQTQMAAQRLLAGVQGQLSPAAWVHSLETAQELAKAHGAFIDKLTNRPWYTPETRPYEYGMYYEKAGKPVFTSFKSESEALEAHDKLAKQPAMTGLRLISPYKDRGPGSQYSDAAVQHFVSLEQSAFRSAQQAFANDPVKMAEFQKLYTPGAAILQELGSRGIRKNLQERKFIGGREDIDMLSNSLNYISSMNRANAKNYIRSKTLLQSQDPTLVNEDRLKGLFFDHMNNVLNPPSQSLNWLKQTTTMYYIGGNFSSAAMQSLQTIQATLPHLTRNGVGIVQGMGYFAKANGILFNAYGRGQGIQSDPILQAAFNKATSERIVGFQNVMSQFDHFDDAFVSRVKNFANDSGDTSMTPSKLLQNVSYQTTRILSYMFNHVTEHNTRVAFIAGFNAARDQGIAKGLSGTNLADYAYGEAKRTVEESLHTGGQASRPIGFGQLKGAYGVAGNLYALNHFNFSMISIMARYGLEALGRTGLEGAALHNARKAFGQALVTQLALGGAMGLPFAGATVAMLEELFPNLQLNSDMRTAISGLAGDDHALGGFLADASLKGLATAASPVDVSGRLGLSAVLGEDPYYGFEAKDLLGATGSMLFNMTKGVQQIATGDPSGAVRFMPNALQRMYQAANDSGQVRNAQGQVIFQPSDAQKVLMAVGLRPKDLSHAKEAAMIDERNQIIQSRQLARWYLTQEQALSGGDFVGVKAALYAKAQEDPTFSPTIALHRIVAGAQKSQVVQSPVDRGSASQLRSRESVGQTFGEPTTAQTQPSQVQQLIERAQLERQVGIPGSGQIAHAELAKAQLMDYLMTRYNLDDGQARALISQMGQNRNPVFRAAHPDEVNPLSALVGVGQSNP